MHITTLNKRRRWKVSATIVNLGWYLLCASIAILAVGGCASGPEHRPILVISDFDTSGGFRPHLGQSAVLICRLIDQLDSSDKLDCYRTDNVTAPFYLGQVPDSGEAFQLVLSKELSTSARRRGTFPDTFWQQVAPDVSGSSVPTVVIVFSDGDNDDPSRSCRQSVASAASEIAKNPQVVVLFCGASRENWERIAEQFHPLNARFHLCTASEMSLDEIMQCVGQARQALTPIEKGRGRK